MNIARRNQVWFSKLVHLEQDGDLISNLKSSNALMGLWRWRCSCRCRGQLLFCNGRTREEASERLWFKIKEANGIDWKRDHDPPVDCEHHVKAIRTLRPRQDAGSACCRARKDRRWQVVGTPLLG